MEPYSTTIMGSLLRAPWLVISRKGYGWRKPSLAWGFLFTPCAIQTRLTSANMLYIIALIIAVGFLFLHKQMNRMQNLISIITDTRLKPTATYAPKLRRDRGIGMDISEKLLDKQNHDMDDFASSFRHKYFTSTIHPIFSEGELAECYMLSQHAEEAHDYFIKQCNASLDKEILAADESVRRGVKFGISGTTSLYMAEALTRNEAKRNHKLKMQQMIDINLKVVRGDIPLAEAMTIYIDLTKGIRRVVVAHDLRSEREKWEHDIVADINSDWDKWVAAAKMRLSSGWYN